MPSFVALVIGAYFGGPTAFAPSRPWQGGHSPRIFRSRMEPLELAILAGGAFAAGVINTLAGGGSLITVGLLVWLGLPGTIANGTNRIGVLVQSLTSAWRFRSEGVSGFRDATPVLLPVIAGSLVGSYAISQVTPEVFEQLFGVIMLLLLVPMLRSRGRTSEPDRSRPWPAWARALAFFGVGIYGGALQAGIGILLVFAMSRAGDDLVRASSVKVVVIAALTAVAVPVFVWSNQVDWVPALALTVGFAAGGAVGVRLAVRGGERIIRPFLAVAVIALAGRMLGLF